MPATPKQILKRFVDQAWNKKNRKAVHELLTADCRHYMPGLSEPMIGPDAYLQLLDQFTAAFPDCRMETGLSFGEGTHVCLMWTFKGSHKAAFHDFTPSGKVVSIAGVVVATIRRGKIVEIHSMFDNAEFASKLTA
ncbi:MAG: ester cyclase [Acidobacteria bacterium]|nr:ester cyclase [Acidobacteriota bacterium]